MHTSSRCRKALAINQYRPRRGSGGSLEKGLDGTQRGQEGVKGHLGGRGEHLVELDAHELMRGGGGSAGVRGGVLGGVCQGVHRGIQKGFERHLRRHGELLVELGAHELRGGGGLGGGQPEVQHAVHHRLLLRLRERPHLWRKTTPPPPLLTNDHPSEGLLRVPAWGVVGAFRQWSAQALSGTAAHRRKVIPDRLRTASLSLQPVETKHWSGTDTRGPPMLTR
eukprot:1135242-Prorocentrum_minimum.AAC.5